MVTKPFLAMLLALVPLLPGCVNLAEVQAEAERGAYPRARPAVDVTLVPWTQIAGARLVAPPKNAGGAYVKFVRPMAVALRAGELFVADAGVAAVLHISVAGQTMTALAGAPSQPGVRLQAGHDQSLYVLDPVRRVVLRFAPTGQLMQSIAPPPDVVGLPADLALDERRGLLLIADSSLNQLVMMPLMGGSAYPLTPEPRLTRIDSVAGGADGFYVTDVLCHCVAVLGVDGRLRARFGAETLRSPGAIAVDRGERVFVADRFDNSIKVYSGGRHIATVPAATLGVTGIADIAVDEATLAVADDAGARIALLQIQEVRARGGASQ
jgi:hypothetical protein